MLLVVAPVLGRYCNAAVFGWKYANVSVEPEPKVSLIIIPTCGDEVPWMLLILATIDPSPFNGW
jgi:hypothetical protein